MLLFLSLRPLVCLFHCSLDSGNKKNSTPIIKSCAFSFVITLLLIAFCHTQNYVMFHCPTWHKGMGERCSKCKVSQHSALHQRNDLSEMGCETSGNEMEDLLQRWEKPILTEAYCVEA